MAVSDFLEKIGEGLEGGVKAAGRVAGAVLPAVGKSIVNEEAGYAPQIAAEGRQHTQQMEDAQIQAKEQELTRQLDMGRKYGTLTPDQQSQYVDAITNLYSHPRHAGTLMEKLRQAVHPKGAVASPGQKLPDATPQGGTIRSDAQLSDEQKQQDMLKDVDFWTAKLTAAGVPIDQVNAMRNEAIERKMGAATGQPREPKGVKALEQNGSAYGLIDQDSGKQYLPDQLGPSGDAPPALKSQWAAIQKVESDKKADVDKKAKETEQHQADREKATDERQERSFAHSMAMQTRSIENAISLGDYRTAKKEITKVKDAYDGSLDRLSTMEQSYKSALQGDQQAMTNLLMNHVAMTKQQLGAPNRSPTRADVQEAASSLPFSEEIMKKFDANGGVLDGLTLSPDQMSKMVKLAHEKVGTLREHLDRTQSDYAEDLNPQTADGKPAKKGVARAMTPPSAGPKKRVSLNKAMALPENKGKSQDEVKKHIESLGYEAIQ